MYRPPHRSGCAIRPAAVKLALATLMLAFPLGASRAEPTTLDLNGLLSSQSPALLDKETGLVTVPGGVGLVSNGGYTAQGQLTRGTMLGGGVRVSVADTHGAEAGAIGVAPDPLAVWSRRRTVALHTRQIRKGSHSVGLDATLMDARNRTLDPESGERVFGKRNTAFGGAARFGFWDNRVRIANEMAWSRLGADTTTTFTDANEEVRSGIATRHRVEADLVDAAGLTVTGFGGWSRIGRDYIAFRGDAPADRVTRTAGARARYGIVTVEGFHTAFRTNLDPAENVLTLQDTTITTAVTLALDRFRPILADVSILPILTDAALPSVTALLPSMVRFQHDEGTRLGLPEESIGSFGPADISDQARGTDTLTLDWNWLGARTNAVLAWGSVDSRQPGKETADIQDTAFTVTQFFSPEGWTASLGVELREAASAEIGNRSSTERVGLNATLGTLSEDGTTWTATLGLSQSRTDQFDADDVDIRTLWHATAAADLTPMLLEESLRETARLSFMFGLNGRDPAPDDTEPHRVELRMGIAAAMSF